MGSWYMPSFCMACWKRLQGEGATPLDSSRRLFLCPDCLREIWRLRHGQGLTPYTTNEPFGLFRYESLIRDLIWRAKIRDDHGALDLIVYLSSNAISSAFSEWADMIIPAPSSLWGRLRGRLDIGAHIGLSLGLGAKKPTVPAPSPLHWRLIKNAQKDAGERRTSGSRSLPESIEKILHFRWLRSISRYSTETIPSGFRILVVDDVVTTGSTMREIAHTLNKACSRGGIRPQLRFLAFAKSGL